MWGAEMIVYHGSQVEVNKPDVYHSRENVDFGKGFYITPIKDQACKWAARFKKRHGKAVVSAYDLELDKCKGYYSVLEFDELIDKEEAIIATYFPIQHLHCSIRCPLSPCFSS